MGTKSWGWKKPKFQTSDFVGIFVSVQLYVIVHVVDPALSRVPLFVRVSVFINEPTTGPAVGGACVCVF